MNRNNSQIIIFLNLNEFVFLRQAEQALEVLLKFKHMETRKVIQDQLMSKFEVIMDQFIQEVSMVENIFTVSCKISSELYYSK